MLCKKTLVFQDSITNIHNHLSSQHSLQYTPCKEATAKDKPSVIYSTSVCAKVIITNYATTTTKSRSTKELLPVAENVQLTQQDNKTNHLLLTSLFITTLS